MLIPVWLPSDSRYVASAGKDRDVRLWSVQGTRSRCIGQLSGHTAYVTAIAFTHTTAQGTPALGCVPGEVTLSLVGIGDGGGASESEDFQLCNICQVLFVVSNAKGKGPKTITNQPLSV